MRLFFTILFLSACDFLFAGTITTSVSSLPAFGGVVSYHSSTSLRYTVSGSSLTANLVITAPEDFDISQSYTTGYRKIITLVPSSGSVPATTIFVRYSPSASASANRDIVHSSAGSANVNIAVSGHVINPIPAFYYGTVTNQTGAALKTVLYNKILGHTVIPYGSGTCTNCVWGAYETSDIQPNGKVWDVYSTRFDQASPYEYTMRTDQCGTYSAEGDCYNREHSFPQSWFNNASPMVSDLFHIYASDGKVNGTRNNYPYGYVTSASSTSQYGGKLGTGTGNFGYSGTVFEPIDEYKGDFARSYFYMATRYENVIASWTANSGATDALASPGNSFPAFNAWQLGVLLSWNNLDPVSDKEIKRNNAIYALQANRNPFIDSPQFVQRIWGGAMPAEPTMAASSGAVPFKNNTFMQLTWATGNGNRRLVVMRATSSPNVVPKDSVQYTANTTFGSTNSHIGNGNYVIYNGTGTTVTASGLTQGTNYTYTVYEYNGWYGTNNYQVTGALTGSSSTLPVSWISFTATREFDDHITLQWHTASEINNDHFVVERSYDNEKFTAISSVKGSGTSYTKNSYAFSDDLLTRSSPAGLPQVIYYRIKQVDADGAFTYTGTEEVNLSEKNDADDAAFSVSPNPFSDSFRISFSEKPQGVSVVVYNVTGARVAQKNIDNENEIKMDELRDLPAGIYFLQVQYGPGNQKQLRLLKK